MVDVLSEPALIGKFYAYVTKVVRNATGRKRKTYVDEEDWLLVYEDPSQVILTGEQFYALRERFQHNRENSPRNTKHYYPPLRSLVFCKCGRRMVGVYRSRKPWYRCLNCGIWIKTLPLWNEVKQGVREMLLQRTVVEVFGGWWGIIYVSLLFAVLHMGFLSWIDVIFVFAVALFFGWVVKKAGSLFGVTLSHGITNILLYLVVPFFF